MRKILVFSVVLLSMLVLSAVLYADSADDQFSEGNYYMSQGDYHAAIAKFQRAYELRPSRFEPYTNIGLCYNELQDYNNSVYYFKKSLDINSNNAKAWSGLANAYNALGDNNQAETSYKNAIRIDPSDPLTHENLARLLYKAKRYSEAKEHITKAKHGYQNQGNYDMAGTMEQLEIHIEENLGY